MTRAHEAARFDNALFGRVRPLWTRSAAAEPSQCLSSALIPAHVQADNRMWASAAARNGEG
jgi:hypothetical protein